MTRMSTGCYYASCSSSSCNPKPSKTYSLFIVTRNIPDGGFSFGFNSCMRALCVCSHIVHICMLICTCGGWGLTLDVLFSLSSLYFLTQGLSLSLKLTASARLAEQQPLGILLFPPFECRNYSQELHGCWESKLGCSCLYSK